MLYRQFEITIGPRSRRFLAAIVVIPARFGSTRFPAKIVARDTGKPLVQHVVDRAKQCRKIEQVIVATDDQRIVDALREYETQVVMTSPLHQSGTDRIAEVARGSSADIIVNVQGDEPEIEPAIIDALVQRLEDVSDDDMATACTPFPAEADPLDSNLVKVVMNQRDRAIYFSRSLIPNRRDAVFSGNAPYYLHLGIYAYRRPFLLAFSLWPPTPLEMTEKLEQLRAIEHERSIYVLKTDRATHGIDTPAQYAEFVRRYKGSS